MRSRRGWIALSIGEVAMLVGKTSGVSIKRCVLPAISRMHSEAQIQPSVPGTNRPSGVGRCQYHAHGHAGRDACVILAAPADDLLTLIKRTAAHGATLARLAVTRSWTTRLAGPTVLSAPHARSS